MRILITGASRGLGLEFVKQYLERGEEVIATCRNPESAQNLQALASKFGDAVTVLQLDVEDRSSMLALHDSVSAEFDGIDVLLNNAGIMTTGDGGNYALGDLHAEDHAKIFRVNTIAPLLMSEVFLDLLKGSDDPKIINISSWLGSIEQKNSVYRYGYCASKSALNMYSKMLSIDLKEKKIIVLAMHPGHVQTDLGGSNAPLLPDESIRGMVKVIDGLSMQDSGKFLSWLGEEIPW